MSECHRQLVSRPPVRNWREWNLEQFQKSPSLRRVSMVGGTVFARLIGRPRAPPPPTAYPFPSTLSCHAEWLSESDIEDFHGYTSGIARFHATCFVSCPPRNRAFATLPRKWGDWGAGWGTADDSIPLTLTLPLPSVRVIELHGRGVPISGTVLSAAFNCVSISSRNSTGTDQTFRFRRIWMDGSLDSGWNFSLPAGMRRCRSWIVVFFLIC